MEGLIRNITISFIIAINIFIILNNLKAIKLTSKSILFCIFGNMMIALLGIYTETFYTLPFSIVFIFIFLVYISRSIYNSLIIMIIIYSIEAISDIVSAVILVKLLETEYAFIKQNIRGGILLYLVVLVFSYVISKIIYLIFFRSRVEIESLKKVTLKNDRIILIYTCISLILIHLKGAIYKCFFLGVCKRNVSINMIFIAIYFIFGFIIICFSRKMIKRQMIYDNKFKEFEQLMEYTDIIENMIDESKKIKHDYVNILSTINGYIQDKDLSGLDKYMNDEILNVGSSVGSSKYLNLQNIRISGVKGLLSSKIINASTLKLEVNIEIIEEIDDISVDIIDISRILGILLDNAIEAAVLSEDKKLNIAIIKNDDSIVFIISNSFLGYIEPIHKLYKKGFSTKGKNRGIGLSIAKDTIDKHSNILLNTDVDDNLFRQELIVYNKDE
ncbi:GHKL domain-containing protein [Clostridium sp. CS001]|uniref:sensor histidine kinase n=1 Tax=Clostridium sp. CS001 TaxID=2880648 RepID=UPI001CF5C155|nr:GHKL domain-containing protein [Clostridium sp. CS001]MCB2291741.1 GHKL domain-containing protein [Clostridium sp. CS001]